MVKLERYVATYYYRLWPSIVTDSDDGNPDKKVQLLTSGDDHSSWCRMTPVGTFAYGLLLESCQDLVGNFPDDS